MLGSVVSVLKLLCLCVGNFDLGVAHAGQSHARCVAGAKKPFCVSIERLFILEHSVLAISRSVYVPSKC